MKSYRGNICFDTETRLFFMCSVAPGAPRNLRALVISTTGVVLAVDEPLENGGAEILGYRINYDQNRGVEVQSGWCYEKLILLLNVLMFFMCFEVSCFICSISVYAHAIFLSAKLFNKVIH